MCEWERKEGGVFYVFFLSWVDRDGFFCQQMKQVRRGLLQRHVRMHFHRKKVAPSLGKSGDYGEIQFFPSRLVPALVWGQVFGDRYLGPQLSMSLIAHSDIRNCRNKPHISNLLS